jgi:ATP-dependent Clp protease ATP-binding subunit ClpA
MMEAMLTRQTGQANLEPTAQATIHSHFSCVPDLQFGSPPLKRAVQKPLLNPLSMKLLEDECKTGRPHQGQRRGR